MSKLFVEGDGEAVRGAGPPRQHERQARPPRGGGAGGRGVQRAGREEEPERVLARVRVADARRAGEDEVRVCRGHHVVHAHLGQLLQGE